MKKQFLDVLIREPRKIKFGGFPWALSMLKLDFFIMLMSTSKNCFFHFENIEKKQF